MISMAFPLMIFTGGISWLVYDFVRFNLPEPLLHFIINLVLATIITLSLSIYIKIFKGKQRRLSEFFGWGDVLLIYCITPLFEYQTFLYTILGGVIISIIYAFLMSIFRKGHRINVLKIPFAAWLSVAVSVFIISNNNFL